MDTTLFLAKVIGPVLVLRSVSILFDRAHFKAMLDGLDKEISTISFSLFPIALLMSAIALAIVHEDRATPAGMMITVIAYGGILKASLLILFPKLIVAKAQMLGRAGFLNVVVTVCAIVGAYFCWIGYI